MSRTGLVSRCGLAGAALAAMLLAGATGASAQDGVTLEPLSVTTATYPQLATWHERQGRPCCVPEVLAEDGQVLLRIDIEFDIPWSEELSRVSAYDGDITITLPNGESRRSIGFFYYEGQFRRSSVSFSVSRPSNWQEEDRNGFFNVVFLIPQETATVDLVLGELYSGTIAVPPTFAKPPVAADGAEFQILGAALMDGVTAAESVNGIEISNDITPPEGMSILEIEIAIRGIEPNDFDSPDRFYWHTYDFGLVYDEIHNAGLIGERFSNRILDWQFNSATIGGDAAVRRIYYAVPSDVGTMQLYFGDVRVADVAPN